MSVLEGKDWLPIGSVVHLNENGHLVMIAGVMQRDENTGRLWDYMGFPYPEGNMKPGESLMFNRADIDRVYFLGYQSLSGIDFLEFLQKNEAEFCKRQLSAEQAAQQTGEAPASDGSVNDAADESTTYGSGQNLFEEQWGVGHDTAE
ncbi:DUF4176 domain-containing protein [Bifidobacterium sp. ESL0769]|uniref:DUF4176 domain-containing protein n=1 Tax=Bifidobacterium sp. ESL0769 TaxID=2983229 RepID=UPI0023F6AC7A|nr:DUF4176 domain-containing protein [Bifidobacterium sp. ESL0769]WEV68173.1 DUF4176 domain-containing protein [Bifidobacterium sp. ESL0769]